jgi:uncharacterized protein with PQ loop repeat
MPSLDASCAAAQGPGSTFATVLAVVLFLGTTLSFVPQWIEIIRNRSSRGVSPFAQWLGGVGLFGQCCCALLVALHCGIFARCVSERWWPCTKDLLSTLLLVGSAVGQIPIPLLIVSFFQVEREETARGERRAMLITTAVCSTLLVTTAAWAGVLLSQPGGSHRADQISLFIDVLSPTAAVAMALTYLPQIVTTFRIKGPGSLSLVTLGIQVPGSGAVCVSLFLDGETWGVLLPSLSAFFFGVVLAVEVIYYVVLARRAAKRRKDGQGEDDPLLINKA